MPASRVALAVLGVAMVVVVFMTTPWRTISEPVPGGPVAVDWSRDFTPHEKAREDRFHRGVRPPAYLSLAVGLVLAGVLGLTPLGARLVTAAARPLGGAWIWQVLLGGLALALIARLATLPFSAWSETVERSYGLSTRSWGGFAADLAKGFALSTALTLGVLLGFYALMRAMPRTWWVPGTAAGALLVIALSFGYPVLVEPVFNRFTPMDRGPLRTELLDLAARDGVPVCDVLVADASRRTSTLNAYVSGFGSTRRIVVYDTLLRGAAPREVELIVAHELGHAKKNDVLRGTLVGALGVAFGVCALFTILQSAALLRRAGVPSAGDPRSLASVLFVIAVLSAVAGPAQDLISRRVEARADVHALGLTRDPTTFAQMQRRLALANLSDLDPNPVVYGLFTTHPSVTERIALARSWARVADVPEPPNLARSGSTGTPRSP
jgi:STE24 endopeptidase